MENQNFRNTTKQKLSEFNLDEIRGSTIDRLYQIENKIDRIISGYFGPEKKDDFEKIILNSSIIPIGSKLKILRNIPSFDKNIITKIQKLLSIRNAFAHLPVTEDLEINIQTNDSGEMINTEVSVMPRMEIMNSSGQIKTHYTKDIIEEFGSLDNKIQNYLLNFLGNH